jgi:hypothetical protein
MPVWVGVGVTTDDALEVADADVLDDVAAVAAEEAVPVVLLVALAVGSPETQYA